MAIRLGTTGGPLRWLNRLSAPFLWIMLSPLVTVPLSFSLFFLLTGYHEAEEVGLPPKPAHEYFEAGPTLIAFTLPGLLNVAPFAWALSAKRGLRKAAAVAGLLGLVRLSIPPAVLLLFFHRVTAGGTSYVEFDTFRYVAPPPPFVEVWLPGFAAWIGSRFAWGTLEWRRAKDESALDTLRRAQQLHDESRWEEAMVEFDKAIFLDPELAAAWEGRGSTCAHLGDPRQAFADMEKALSLTSDAGLRARIEKGIERLKGG